MAKFRFRNDRKGKRRSAGSEKERYYLFAGMGGKAARRKGRIVLAWAMAAGLAISGGLVVGLYLINHP